MSGDRRLRYAEPNFVQEAPEFSRRYRWADGAPVAAAAAGRYLDQYAVPLLGLPDAHVTSRGAGTTVAVLDTGFQLDHAALAGHLTGGYDFVDDDPDPAEARTASMTTGTG